MTAMNSQSHEESTFPQFVNIEDTQKRERCHNNFLFFYLKEICHCILYRGSSNPQQNHTVGLSVVFCPHQVTVLDRAHFSCNLTTVMHFLHNVFVMIVMSY
ncbi:hypothetical protein PO909_011755 [Leuciscus waleckii]